MVKTAAAAVLFCLCSIFVSSCSSWRVVKVCPGLNVNNEVIIQPELREMISEKRQKTKVVLRVPAAPKKVTQETQKEIDRRYDYIERELAIAGFAMRDRSLLEKVLSEGKPASYAEIARVIDTDLILEILYMGPYDFTHKKYYDTKAGRLVELSNPSIERKKPGSLSFPMEGGRLDCRVVTVKDGTVSGMFTIYNFPCEGVCEFEVRPGKEWRNPEPNPGAFRGWSVGNGEQNARQLARLLAQTLREGEIVIASVQSGSVAQKQDLRKDDVILKINGNSVCNVSQAVDLLLKADEKIDILIKRDGQEKSVTFKKQFAQPLGIRIAYRTVSESTSPAAAPEPAKAEVTPVTQSPSIQVDEPASTSTAATQNAKPAKARKKK